MILTFDKYGNLISSDTSDDIIQGTTNANTLSARFEGLDIQDYIPFINFERSDGELSPTIPIGISGDSVVYTFSDSWITAKDGILKCSISLKQNNVVKKTANFNLNVIKSINGLEVHYIEEVVYNELITRLSRQEVKTNRLTDLGVLEIDVDVPNIELHSITQDGLYTFNDGYIQWIMLVQNRNGNVVQTLIGNAQDETNNMLPLTCFTRRFVEESDYASTLINESELIDSESEQSVSGLKKFYKTPQVIGEISNNEDVVNKKYVDTIKTKVTNFTDLGSIPTPPNNVNNQVLNSITTPGTYTFSFNDGVQAIMVVSDLGLTQSMVRQVIFYYVSTDTNIIYRNFNGSTWNVVTKNMTSKEDVVNTANDVLEQSKHYTNQKVADLVNSAPDKLDTLGELAQALEDNKDVLDVVSESVTTNRGRLDNIDEILSNLKIYDYVYTANPYIVGNTLYLENAEVVDNVLVLRNGSVKDGTLVL